jgi:hypothetical protein
MTKTLRATAGILLCATLLMASGCKVSGDIETATIALERAYVPALVLSMIGSDEDAGKRAVEIYAAKWEEFRGRYAGAHPENSWSEAVALVDLMVGDARAFAADGKLMEAHVVLEGVREAFREARADLHIEFVTDHLTVFNTLVERTAHTASDKTIMPDEAEYLRGLIPQMETEWLRVEQSDFDRKAFGFTDEMAARFATYASSEGEAIRLLAASLAHGDERATLAALGAVKQGYTNVFRLFGNFPAVGP